MFCWSVGYRGDCGGDGGGGGAEGRQGCVVDGMEVWYMQAMGKKGEENEGDVEVGSRILVAAVRIHTLGYPLASDIYCR